MKATRSMQWVMLFAALVMLGVACPALATQADDVDQLTVSVDPILAISDDIGNFTIKFTNATGSAKDSISTGQTVGYLISANNMPNTALSGALTAKISSALTGIQVRATGGTYTNDGSGDNGPLTPASATVNVGTTAAILANKPATSTAAGKVMTGKYFVNWNALATTDLSPGAGGTVTLTVTLKDA